MAKPLPSGTADRARIAQLTSPRKENIGEPLRNKKVFFLVNEAEADKQKCINVLVGSLDTPNETFLIECLPLESSSHLNSSIILHAVDDVLRQLRTKGEIFALLPMLLCTCLLLAKPSKELRYVLL